MPDLFGVFRQDALTSSDIAGFQRMRKQLEYHGSATAEIIELRNASVGVLANHPADLTHISRDNSTTAAVFIGEAARNPKFQGARQLVRQLGSQFNQYSSSVVAPSADQEDAAALDRPRPNVAAKANREMKPRLVRLGLKIDALRCPKKDRRGHHPAPYRYDGSPCRADERNRLDPVPHHARVCPVPTGGPSGESGGRRRASLRFLPSANKKTGGPQTARRVYALALSPRPLAQPGDCHEPNR